MADGDDDPIRRIREGLQEGDSRSLIEQRITSKLWACRHVLPPSITLVGNEAAVSIKLLVGVAIEFFESTDWGA